MSEFYQYFKENMDGLGFPAPESLFGNAQLAIGSASTLVALMEKFGNKVTVREIIGSIAVATGRSLAGGTSLSDVLLNAQMHHLHRPWLPAVMLRHPEIYPRRRK